MNYAFSMKTLELITGEETTYNSGDIWKTKGQANIQILWMRKDSEYPVYSTEGKFFKLDDLAELVSRELNTHKSGICGIAE